jgi:hypothetical protein
MFVLKHFIVYLYNFIDLFCLFQGFEESDILAHINEHMLHPSVSFAVSLRRLLRMNKTIHEKIIVKDQETGEIVIDNTQIKNYILVTNQITSIYKMGEQSKLMFSVSKDMVKEDT